MLKNRNWFPSNTEIYTTQGWVNIEMLEKRDYELVGYEYEELVRTRIKEFNKYSFEGNISSYKTSKLFIEGHYRQNKIIRYAEEIILPKAKDVHYNGYLYNLVTSCNSFIMRNFRQFNYNDYNIVQCVVK